MTIILADDPEIPDPLERYISRLLRRDVFEAMSEHEFDSGNEWNIIMFGSGVVQKYRPLPGYPIRRMARDLDIGVTFPSGGDLIEESKERIGENIIKIVDESGAGIIRESVVGIRGFDGFRIEKTYTAGEIEDRLRGRLEGALVDVRGDMRASLKISEVILRDPLLTPIPFGNKGFFHEDVREVAAIKIARMLTPEKFAIRDIIDIYNMSHVDPKVIDYNNPELRDMTRLLVIGTIAEWGMPTSQTRSKLDQTEENIAKISRRLGIDSTITVIILTHVQELVSTIFPKDLKRAGDLPDHVRGELNFSRREVEYFLAIEGIGVLPGNARKVADPQNNPHILKEDYPGIAEKYPEIFDGIRGHHEINNRVRQAKVSQITPDF